MSSLKVTSWWSFQGFYLVNVLLLTGNSAFPENCLSLKINFMMTK